MEYLALIQDAEQYSPDSFRNITRSKLINSDTTLQELIKWQQKLYPCSKQISSGHIISMEIISCE